MNENYCSKVSKKSCNLTYGRTVGPTMIALEVYKKKKLLNTLLLTICICKAVCHVQIWTIHVFNERKYNAYYTSVHLIDYLFANKTRKKKKGSFDK